MGVRFLPGLPFLGWGWPQLRFGATGPRLSEMGIPSTGSRTQSTARVPLLMGRKGRSMRLLYTNSYFAGNGTKTTPATTLAFVKIALFLYGGSSTATPVTFSGSRSVTLAAGASIWSDPIPPSAFGLSQYQAGQQFWHQESRSGPSSVVFPVGPTCSYSGAEGDGFFCVSTPANYIDQVDVAGNMSTPTGALVAADFGAAGFDGQTPGPGVPANNMGCGPTALVVEATDPSESSVLVIGTSSASGREDTRTPSPVFDGWGFVDRGAQTLVVPFQHATRSGANIAALGANTDIDLLYAYADKLFVWVGNNGIDGGETPAQEIANLGIITAKFAKPDTTVSLGMPRTDSTDDWATDVNQTYQSGAAGISGNYVTLSRLLALQVRAGNVKSMLPFPGTRSVNDILHWLPG